MTVTQLTSASTARPTVTKRAGADISRPVRAGASGDKRQDAQRNPREGRPSGGAGQRRLLQDQLVREERMVTEHLPLVGYLVSEILGRLPAHVSRDELTSAGMAALAQAGRSFDESRGVPFARFASTRIRG
ncbi:sigma-70 family RNA polymerase sigma factor, partial [Burkholderia cepacia]|uniref:sigma-70 family RNA polymerase sigma factor n=1 Tax=Burkholderia cepacia TaxID=292 RepID=UPI0023F9B19C